MGKNFSSAFSCEPTLSEEISSLTSHFRNSEYCKLFFCTCVASGRYMIHLIGAGGGVEPYICAWAKILAPPSLASRLFQKK